MNETVIAAAQLVREGRREMARWRALKQNAMTDDYETWERAGRELEHWTAVTRWREADLVDVILREIEG
jgi:hypothetical protein